jgi:hypothetical protein
MTTTTTDTLTETAERLGVGVLTELSGEPLGDLDEGLLVELPPGHVRREAASQYRKLLICDSFRRRGNGQTQSDDLHHEDFLGGIAGVVSVVESLMRDHSTAYGEESSGVHAHRSRLVRFPAEVKNSTKLNPNRNEKIG